MGAVTGNGVTMAAVVGGGDGGMIGLGRITVDTGAGGAFAGGGGVSDNGVGGASGVDAEELEVNIPVKATPVKVTSV